MIYMIIVIALAGFLLWAVQTYVPMDAGVKKVLSIAVILLIVLWVVSILLQGAGSLSGPGRLNLP